MAKKEEAIIGSVLIRAATNEQEVTGTLVSYDENQITISAKLPRTARREVRTYPLDQITAAYLSEEADSTSLYVKGASEYTIADVTLSSLEGGVFIGQTDDQIIVVGKGNWTFFPAADEEVEEKPKAKAKTKEEPAPKAKGKAKAEVEEGDEGEEYVPEEGDYVDVTDSEDETVSGTVVSYTAKKLVIEDADGENQTFKPADVKVEKATPPKKGKGKAAPADAEEKPAKGKGKATKGDDDDGWNE